MTTESQLEFSRSEEIISPVLLKLDALPTPRTVCMHCPKAVWQLLAGADSKRYPRVYCTALHAIIDEMLMDCDLSYLPPAPVSEYE